MKPRLPEVPSHLDLPTRRFLTLMREAVHDLHSVMPPQAPANVIVTPVAYGNNIKFTRSADADKHFVLWNTSPSLSGAAQVDVGQSAEWTHDVAKDGVQRWYWVKAVSDGKESQPIGPFSGTTLGAATPLASALGPTPPVQSGEQTIDRTTGHVISASRGSSRE